MALISFFVLEQMKRAGMLGQVNGKCTKMADTSHKNEIYAILKDHQHQGVHDTVTAV